jgi:protein TonB
MDFDAFNRAGIDTVRVRRLVLGYVIGVVAVSLGLSFIFLTSKRAVALEEEESAIEAQLVTEPELAPVEPPPPPPTPEAPKKAPRPQLQTPVEIPRDPPKEVEVKPEATEATDPFADKEEVAPPAPAVVEAPRPPPRPSPVAPRGPIRVTEDVTPPSPLSQSMPELPASAKAAGIEGTVIVKYVVSESGTVTSAQVVKGPAELHAVCLSAVKSWRFQPATLESKAVAVVRIHRFRFKITT